MYKWNPTFCDNPWLAEELYDYIQEQREYDVDVLQMSDEELDARIACLSAEAQATYDTVCHLEREVDALRELKKCRIKIEKGND